MRKLYESEYYDINKRFRNEIKSHGKRLSFSIIGTPLRSSKILVIGNNWGGNENSTNQSNMPLINDILAEQTNQTYRGYLNFFIKIYDDDKLKAIDFLNHIVFTNGNFIRTPNEKKQYNEILTFGYEITTKYLREIIDLIGSNIIICFGNSERSATRAIFKSIGLEEDFWKVKDIQIHKTANGWLTYHLSKCIKGIDYNIFSFPHASRFNLWKKNIKENENFKELRNELKNWL